MSTGEPALRLTDYLEHMLEAARLARGYITDMSQAEFLRDRRTQQAVVLNLITLGRSRSAHHQRISSIHGLAPRHPMVEDERDAQPNGARLF